MPGSHQRSFTRWTIGVGAYPRLEADITADVFAVGGGITGTLIADELSLAEPFSFERIR